VGSEGRTRTRLDPETRREQIVSAAEAVFQGRDPADVTFEEIAIAAGVSRALVYNYFGDKSGLIAAVYLRSFERLDDTLRAALTGISTPSERLRLVITCYLEFARCHTAAWGLIGTSEATLHPVVQDARRSRCERMAEAWGGTPEARVLARAIVGFLEAASLEWVESGPSDVDDAVRLLHTVLWSGLENLPASDAALDRESPSEIVVG
jgi:AcrR family transcriptional regulator